MNSLYSKLYFYVVCSSFCLLQVSYQSNIGTSYSFGWDLQCHCWLSFCYLSIDYQRIALWLIEWYISLKFRDKKYKVTLGFPMRYWLPHCLSPQANLWRSVSLHTSHCVAIYKRSSPSEWRCRW